MNGFGDLKVNMNSKLTLFTLIKHVPGPIVYDSSVYFISNRNVCLYNLSSKCNYWLHYAMKRPLFRIQSAPN